MREEYKKQVSFQNGIKIWFKYWTYTYTHIHLFINKDQYILSAAFTNKNQYILLNLKLTLKYTI